MPTRNPNIVIGQKLTSVKVQRAKEPRRNMTPEERLLWENLRRNQLGFHFRRQQIVDGYIADFYCHQAGLVVETDGDIHDAYRDDVIKAHELQVLRVRNAEVRSDPDGVLQRIAAACRARRTKPPTPFPAREGAFAEPPPFPRRSEAQRF